MKKLWAPGSPFLYDLKFTLTSHGKKVDEVAGYFGLRKVSIAGRAILINGRRVFQRLILDQGFFPDGVWTAPSDGELKADIERSLAAGFNGARRGVRADRADGGQTGGVLGTLNSP